MSGVEFLPHDVGASAPSPSSPEPDPTVAKSRRRLGPRSLTARLVVGVVALVVVLVAVISGGTYLALSSFLGERLDQQLQTTAGSSTLKRTLLDGDVQGGPAVQAPQNVWVVVLDPMSADVVYFPHGYGLEQASLSASDRKRIVARQTTDPTTVRTLDGHELRVTIRAAVVRPVSVFGVSSTGQPATLVVGLSTAEERKTIKKLIDLEVLIGTAAILVAFAATFYGVRLSLRRLRRVTATANEVAAELSPTGAGLDRRVDGPDDDTEVGQLADSMNTLLSAVETQFAARLESEQRLRQFLADASHELRTPLTSIRGYAELSRMQRAAGGDADDNLARIESEGTRMSRLVEDLLMLARGEQQADAPPARELVDAGELIDDATRDTRAAFPERRVEAHTVPDLHLIGDHDQLLRALRNLMANAAVHTAPERPIVVRCAADGDSVIIQVIDGGPGLSPDEAAHVFERFWRADKARTRARGGSGLGLSIVAAIVAAHGGTVRFDSTVEQGTTVSMRLPAVGY
jgi:two-component system OmpR family sensor kinase